MKRKSVYHDEGILRVETPLGVIDIDWGGTDAKKRRIENVTVYPNRLSGAPKVALYCVHKKMMRRMDTHTRLLELKRSREL